MRQCNPGVSVHENVALLSVLPTSVSLYFLSALCCRPASPDDAAANC